MPVELETETVIKHDFKIEIPIYQCEVQVYLCSDILEACIELSLNKDIIADFKNVGLAGLTVVDEPNPGKIVLLLEDDLKTSTIVHETNHIVGFILLMRGIPLVRESMEAYAYLQEFIYNAVRIRLKPFIKE